MKKLVFIAIVYMVSSCASDSEEDILQMAESCGTSVSFQSEVQDILTNNCAISGCHNGDNGSSRNYLIFDNVQNNSQAIRSRTSARTMPPSSSGITLTSGQIQTISCWVEQGSQNN